MHWGTSNLLGLIIADSDFPYLSCAPNLFPSGCRSRGWRPREPVPHHVDAVKFQHHLKEGKKRRKRWRGRPATRFPRCRLCRLQDSLCDQALPPGGHRYTCSISARSRAQSCSLHSRQDAPVESTSRRPALPQSQPVHHFQEHQLEPSTVQRALQILAHLIFTSAVSGGIMVAPILKPQTETQRGEVTFQRLHS